MIRVSIIGSGNVAQHLIVALSKTTDIELVQVFARKDAAVAHLTSPDKIYTNFNDIIAADLFIIAITDDAITEVSAAIPFSNELVVHTSGSVSIEAINNKNRPGVFYPLQTFSKSKEVDFKTIPICIETKNEKDFEILEKVAKSISNTVYKINSEQRKALHIAAVFVCNFVNYLYQIGNDICIENDLPFDILKPLIQETANKILTLSPNQAQTGPAKRKDIQTINAHLNFLSDDNQKEIYKMLTKSIIDNGKKL
jgi:predicted short-subunit dehydrogenase-like oxidoreductase (DUF2520 family)